jgi:hypothetical protein
MSATRVVGSKPGTPCKDDISEHGYARRRDRPGARLKSPLILFADQRRRVSARSAVRGLATFAPHW